MKLSVVITTLNNREQLCASLDAVTPQLPPEAEVIVVNGPSTDGTSGTVRDRSDVDVLVEISERSRSVSRNAGLECVEGEAVAYLGDDCVVEPGWFDSIETSFSAGADVVTGPISGRGGRNEPAESHEIAGRSVTPVSARNVAFSRTVIETLDGFDEYLDRGSTLDCAHRLAPNDFDVTWNGEMSVRWTGEPDGSSANPWGERYRALGYRLAKNYGVHPTVMGHTLGRAIRDGFDDARSVVRGETRPTQWLRNGIDVTTNAIRGLVDGLQARYQDRSTRRNPNGVSSRHDRAVHVYDRR